MEKKLPPPHVKNEWNAQSLTGHISHKMEAHRAEPHGAAQTARLLATHFGIGAVEEEPKGKPANLDLIRVRKRSLVKFVRNEVPAPEKLDEPSQAKLRERISEMIDKDDDSLAALDKNVLLQSVLDELFGFGPLSPLLRDPDIGDIIVNDSSTIYVEQNGRLQKLESAFDSNEHFLETINKMLKPFGMHLNGGCPLVSVRLPNGTRVEATHPPISPHGPTLTIRTLTPVLMPMEVLVEKGVLSNEMAAALKRYVEAGLNIVVSGFEGSGRIAVLNTLCAYLPPQSRVITVEDVPFIRLMHDHWVRLQLPGHGAGDHPQQTDMEQLVHRARQMRPDRIIVGEHLGEGSAFLQAFGYGNTGAMAVRKANSSSECLQRLEHKLRLADLRMTKDFARELIACGIQVIVQMKRLADGTRRVAEIAELNGLHEGEFALNTIYRLETGDKDNQGIFQCRFVRTASKSQFVGEI